MTAALAERPDATITNENGSSTARARASRANGRRSRGPVSRDGKARSRQNGCKDGLTGAGIVLPPDAAAEVGRREAGFALDFRPVNAVERELVRQMALASWRCDELMLRISRHDDRVNADRFAHWTQDETIAAAELGRGLADDPETIVARLERSSAGCEWLIGRWELLLNALPDADDDVPGCRWTDADLALALDLLGRPRELRHLDDWVGQLEELRARAQSGSLEATYELREIVTGQLSELAERRGEVWEEVEQPRLRDLRSGLGIDLSPDGARLHRYEAAADRLFRSAWTKLEKLRKERGEPLMPRAPRTADRAEPPRPARSAAPSTTATDSSASGLVPESPMPTSSVRTALPAFPVLDDARSSLLADSAPPPVLDLWVSGPPRHGIDAGLPPRNKTNPTPSASPRRGSADAPARRR